MPERTIISPHFSWFDEEGFIHTAYRGQTVTIPQEYAERGDALNCFRETRVEHPTQGETVEEVPEPDFTEEEPVVPPTEGQGDGADDSPAADLSGEDLTEWFKRKQLGDLEAAGLSAEQAAALLDIENDKSSPREPVVEFLTAVATDPAGE